MEDSAKHLVNSLQLTENSGIGLLREGNLSYVLPSHSEIVHFSERIATRSSVKFLNTVI